MIGIRRAVMAGLSAAALLPVVAATPAMAALPPGCSLAANTVTCTFNFTGDEQIFTVPAGVTSISIEATGGKGGTNSEPNFAGVPGAGGYGAVVSATLAVSSGQVLYVEVGGAAQVTAGGWNGGGHGAISGSSGRSGGGGGASDIRTVSCGSPCDPLDAASLASRFLVAGGGGGGGSAFQSNGGDGGSAGSTADTGQDGVATPGAADSGGKGGGGGTSPGGTGGAAGTGGDPAMAGTDGSSGQGGSGQPGANSQEPGGGGGGGYYGGGGGGSGARLNSSGNSGGGGGGGGGESFVHGLLTATSMSTDATGTSAIVISYEVTFQPDGWIRMGSKPFAGNNVYNPTGLNQTRLAKPVIGARVLFRIAVQNDGMIADRFDLTVSGPAAPGYRIRYYRGSNEITAAIVAGNYTTPMIAPGHRYVIEAWVKATSSAGPQAARLVTMTSVSDNTEVDSVKFVVRPR